MSNVSPRVSVPKSPRRLTSRQQDNGNRLKERDVLSIVDYDPSIQPASSRSSTPSIRTPTPLPIKTPTPLPPISPANRSANIDFQSRLNLQEDDEYYIQQDPKNPKKTIHIKKTAVLSEINDMIHLIGSKNPTGSANVEFSRDGQYIDKVSEKFHSFILLARSTWFRRSWREVVLKNGPEKYNFTKTRDNTINKYDIGICIDDTIDLPSNIDGQFSFKLDLPTAPSSEKENNDFRKAFKQFKKYIYTGDCDINETIAGYLIALAQALEVDSLKAFISDYYTAKFKSTNDFDAVLGQMEIAHNYQMEALRDECIRIVNENALQIVNSSRWQEISARYPDLVLLTFKKNAPY